MAAAMLMTAGCSNEENTTYVAEGTPITVNAIVGEMETKAGYSDSNMPQQFYLNIKNTNKVKYSYYALMKQNGSTWESFDATDTSLPALKMYWAGDNENVEVTAATFDFNTASEPSVQTDQSASIDASDALIMATDKNVSPTTKSIDVKLKHLMSKLIITVDLGSDVTYTTNPLTDFVIGGTKTQRAYSFADGTFSDISTSAAAAIQAYTDASVTTSATTGGYVVSYEAIVVPQEVAAKDLTVSFKLGSKTYNWASTELITFESNKQYTLSLKLNPDKLTLGTISLDKWGDATDLGTGTMKSNSIPTLTVTATGQVTNDALSQALNGGTKLKIVGPIGDADETVLKASNITVLDLSEATDNTTSGFSLTTKSGASYTGNAKVTELSLPARTLIKSSAFRNCTKLTKVVIPSTVTTISNYAFAMCSSLSEVTFTATSNLTTIKDKAFYMCTGLTSITIPSGMTQATYQIFTDCSNLKTIKYEGNVTQVNPAVFTDCSSLTDVYLTGCSSFPMSTSSTTPSGIIVHVNSTLYANRTTAENYNQWKNCTIVEN